jgi:cbb3-type cytochrome oxidase subunit 3
MLKAMTAHESFLPVLILLLFMAVFVAVVWYVLADRRKGLYKKMGELPLDDGEVSNGR